MSELTTYNSERIYWAVEQVEQEAADKMAALIEGWEA